MDRLRYSFRHEWCFAASPAAVYDALADVESYPSWWPQIRDGRRIDDNSGEIRSRSVLPFDLVVVASRLIEDPAGMVLRAGLSGDLEGWSQWTVLASGSAALAVFEQEVVVRLRMAQVAGPLARPALRANHAVMMRSGERGLRRYLGRA